MKSIQSIRIAALVIAFFQAMPAVAAGPQRSPAFLILAEDAVLVDAKQALEQRGVWLRQMAPPRVIVAEFPSTVNPQGFAFVHQSFRSPVSLEILEPLGEAAVAAGLNWNQRLLTASAGSRSFASMRTLVAQRSLPAPAHIDVQPASGVAEIRWPAVPGALYYELETGTDPDFVTVLFRNRLMATKTTVPLAGPAGTPTLFVRVRAVDRSGGETPSDVFGAWASASIEAGLFAPEADASAPVLTSPADNLTSDGFTVILEWTGVPSGRRSWVQVASSADFNDVVFDALSDTAEYVSPSAVLREGSAYYWRVRSWESDGRSEWSAPRRFKVGSPSHHTPDMMVNPEAPR